jgi:hypothetical protein
MRRPTLLVALAGLAVVVAVGVVVLWPRQNRITQENFDRIREGMSLAEVEAILGPPGDYRTGPTAYEEVGPTEEYDPTRMEWWTDTLLIDIDFDETGPLERGGTQRAAKAWVDPCTRVPQGPLDNLLWRAKRQWHRWFP